MTLSHIFTIFAMCVVSYLLGNILFADIFTRFFKHNIRNFDSKNPGATNMFNANGKLAGFLVFFCDASKGYLSVIICWVIFKYSINNWISDWSRDNIISSYCIVYFCGIFAILGHCFPIIWIVFLLTHKFDKKLAKKYCGGKGASTSIGVIATISPYLLIVLLIIAIFTIILSTYVAVGMMTGFFSCAVFSLIPQLDFLYLFDSNSMYNEPIKLNWNDNYQTILILFIYILLIWILVVIRSVPNIKNLIKKTETRDIDIFKKFRK